MKMKLGENIVQQDINIFPDIKLYSVLSLFFSLISDCHCDSARVLEINRKVTEKQIGSIFLFFFSILFCIVYQRSSRFYLFIFFVLFGFSYLLSLFSHWIQTIYSLKGTH